MLLNQFSGVLQYLLLLDFLHDHKRISVKAGNGIASTALCQGLKLVQVQSWREEGSHLCRRQLLFDLIITNLHFWARRSEVQGSSQRVCDSSLNN
jgi:hypothetical protein